MRALRSRQFLYPNEIIKLVSSAARERDSLLIRMMFIHAWSPSVIYKLRWHHIDFKSSTVRFATGEHGIHDLNTFEIDSLRRFRGEHDEDAEFVFVRESGKAYEDSSLWRLFRDAGKRAGLDDLNIKPRMIRISKAFLLASKGFSAVQIQEHLNLQSVANALKYCEIIQGDLSG